MIPLASTVSRLSLMLAIVLSAGIVASCQHPDFQEIQTVPLLISPRDNETVYDSVVTFSWQHDAQGQQGLVYELWVDGAMVAEVDGGKDKTEYSVDATIPIDQDCHTHPWIIRVHNAFQYSNSEIQFFDVDLERPVGLIYPDNQTFSCEQEVKFQWDDSHCFKYVIRIEKEGDPYTFFESEMLDEPSYNGYFLEEANFTWHVLSYQGDEIMYTSEREKFSIANCKCSLTPLEVLEFDHRPILGPELALIHDPVQDLFWVFGYNSNSRGRETWVFDPNNRTWEEKTDIVGNLYVGECANSDNHDCATYLPSFQKMACLTLSQIYMLDLNPLGIWLPLLNYNRISDQYFWCSGHRIEYHANTKQLIFMPYHYNRIFTIQLNDDGSVEEIKEIPTYNNTFTNPRRTFSYIPEIDRFVLVFGNNYEYSDIPFDEISMHPHIQQILLFDPYNHTWQELKMEGDIPTYRDRVASVHHPCVEGIIFISGISFLTSRSLRNEKIFWWLQIKQDVAVWRRIIVPSKNPFPTGLQLTALSPGNLILNLDPLTNIYSGKQGSEFSISIWRVVNK